MEATEDDELAVSVSLGPHPNSLARDAYVDLWDGVVEYLKTLNTLVTVLLSFLDTDCACF